jgi:RNA polymerase sigma factor (TIGR02999 family)
MSAAMSGLQGDVSALLQAIAAGDREAFDLLFAEVYGELHDRARRQLGGRHPRSPLRTTSLVHETFLKLGSSRWSACDRAHFFALAGRAMRQIVIDDARRRLRERRGGGAHHLSIDQAALTGHERAEELVALGSALDRLRELDPELAQLVEWRFFAGRSLDEISEFTETSTRTLKRRWRAARAFLFQDLTEQGIG